MSNHQSITINKELPPDTAMEQAIQEANSQPVDTPAPEERPGWLPEKFKSAEDLAKAYSELEKRFSTPAEKPKAEEAPKTGTNFEGYAKEYAETGELSPESIAQLAASGIPESVVRNYIEGLGALSERQSQQIYGIVGGEAQYGSMMEWASDNLSDSEIEAFNDIMEQGNQAAMQMAVRGLQARYTQTVGQPSRLIQGETTGPTSGTFRSIAELTEAMKDPRYQKDPAYRRDVENRLRTSNILGVK
jgi:hypothetical protein